MNNSGRVVWRYIFSLLSIGVCVACQAQTASSGKCLPYAPNEVTLEGTLTRKTFAGPPNYEDIRKGDRPETYWLLQLDKPICVDQSPTDPELSGAVKDVRTIQLVVPEEIYKSKVTLVGARVVAKGSLFGAHTGHHHTRVLLTISNLVAK